MHEEFRNLSSNDDFDSIISKYEDMLKSGGQYYFDVEDFEHILDYYIDINHLGKALRAVRYAFSLHPQAVSLAIKKAQILLKDQNPKRALATLNDIESLESFNNELFITKGHANVMLGNTREAKLAYKKALELVSDKDEAIDLLQNIAQTFQFADQYKMALKYLHRAIELDEHNVFILQELAYCYEKLEDQQSSLKYHRRYLDIDPFSDFAWYSIAKLYKDQGEFEKAIEAFDYAIAINPKYTESIYEIAKLYEENFEFHKAIKYYQDFLDIEKESSEALFNIANCYNYLDDFELALEYYRKVLDTDSYNPDIYHGIGTIFFKQKNYWDALFYAKRATIIDEQNSSYFVLYGKIASKLNLANEAIEAFENALEVKPQLLYNLILLIDELTKRGYYQKAVKHLENSFEFHDDSALVYFRLAALYYITNQKKHALKYFKKGMEIDPKQKANFFKICPEASSSKEVNKMINELSYKDQ
jgi:tetratricopeptide (TPR) repeat protein